MATKQAFRVIPQDTFQTLQKDAGVLLKAFDIDEPRLVSDDIISATTGGISVSCTPVYVDQGEDVDFCTNVKEMQMLVGWDCRMSATLLNTSASAARLALGAADASGAYYWLTSDRHVVPGKTYYVREREPGETEYHYVPVEDPSDTYMFMYYEYHPDYIVTPRMALADTDFTDLWWVGDTADGGAVAVKMTNALSMGGLSIQSSKRGKGQLAVELKGFISMDEYGTVPITYYTIEKDKVSAYNYEGD